MNHHKTTVVIDNERVDIFKNESGRLVIKLNTLPIVELYDCGVEPYIKGEARFDIKELYQSHVVNELASWRAKQASQEV